MEMTGTMRRADRLERTRHYWTGEVQKWRDSGMTQKEYSIQARISIERLGSWKRRLEREELRESGSLVAVPSRIVTSALTGQRAVLTVVVRERYRVEVADTFSPSVLEKVLQVLERL